MKNILLTTLLGIIVATIDIIPMLRMKLDKYAITSAFLFYIIATFIILNTNLFGMPWWLKGGVTAFLLALPTIVLVAKDGPASAIPMIIMSLILGSVIGITGHFFIQ